MLLLFLLPFAGFLWSVPHHEAYAIFLAAICLVTVAAGESISQLTERDAMALTLQLKARDGDLDEWREKVRELDRIVAALSEENQEFRRQALDRKIHEVGAGN